MSADGPRHLDEVEHRKVLLRIAASTLIGGDHEQRGVGPVDPRPACS